VLSGFMLIILNTEVCFSIAAVAAGISSNFSI